MKNCFIVLVLLVVGCRGGGGGNDHINSEPQYAVDLDKLAESPSFFKVEINKTIPLETTDESVLGHIKKAIIKGNRLYIQDVSRHMIQIFSLDGKYVGKLSRQGRGPGEYIKLSDFYVDGESIYVLSADNKKIIQYALNDFNKTIEIESLETATKICISNGHIWVGDVFTRGGLQELAILEDGSIKPFLDIRPEFDNTMSEKPVLVKPQIFFSSENYNLFNQRFTGDVYQLDTEGPKFLLKASSKQPASINIHDRNSFNGFDYIYRVGDILLGKLWGKTDNHFLFVMNLKSGTSSLCNLQDLGLPYLSAITSCGEQFVTFMSTKTFRDGYYEIQPPSNIGIDDVDDFDNPVAVMFSLVENRKPN